jgi:hypothetical protein
MSIFTSIRDSIVGSYVKKFLSKDNLLQPSTWRGVIGAVVGALALHWSPGVQDQVTQLIVQAISTGMLASGTINMVRNEKKK